MSALWSVEDVCEATGGRAGGRWRVSGVSIDSRSAQPGDLFVAIAGPRADGHDFVADALARGAVAALVHRRPPGTLSREALVIVDDTQAALDALARRARARAHGRIAAITGSVGKTGTKEALLHVLRGEASVFGSPASYNNLWGVPLSLARLPPGARFGVFEIGMNHAGEISPLTRLVRPQVAVITTVEAAHTAFFESLEAIADAKAEIFEGLEPAGLCVLNRDNRFYPRLAGAVQAVRPDARVASFGMSGGDYRALEIASDGGGSDVVADLAGRRIGYRVSTPGRHWVANSLAVLAAADALGADVRRCAAALGDLPALDGRGRRHRLNCRGGTFTLIDESYNANPASMRAAIEVLGASALRGRGRRIAVLGRMKELGAESDALHAGLAEPLIRNRVDLVLAAADMIPLLERLPPSMRGPAAAGPAELSALLTENVGAGDVVMVKGSRASGMSAVVDRLRAARAGGRERHVS